MVCFFNFTSQYSVFQGLGFRIQMSYPGNWADAEFAGAIATPQGTVFGFWQFSPPVYNGVSDTTQIDFYLDASATAAYPVNVSGHSYDVLARLPQQGPVILLKGKLAVLDVQTDPSNLVASVGSGASITPTIALKISQFNQAIVLGTAGFSSALIDAAIAAHNADPSAHGGIGGGGGTAITYQATAAQSLSALRVGCIVGGQFVYADCSNPDHGALPLWFLNTAADEGAIATGQGSGIFSDSSWAWSGESIYLGVAGTLTQVAPLNGAFIRVVAEPINAQSLLFRPLEATYYDYELVLD